jgi:hypothetical protein
MSLGTKLRRLGRPGVISSCLCLHRADCVSYEWVVKPIPSDQLPRAICIPSLLQLIVFALLLLPVLHSSPPPSCDSVVASFISPNTHASSLANLIDCASLQHPAAAFYLGMHYVKQGVQQQPKHTNAISCSAIQRLFFYFCNVLRVQSNACFFICATYSQEITSPPPPRF